MFVIDKEEPIKETRGVDRERKCLMNEEIIYSVLSQMHRGQPDPRQEHPRQRGRSMEPERVFDQRNMMTETREMNMDTRNMTIDEMVQERLRQGRMTETGTREKRSSSRPPDESPQGKKNTERSKSKSRSSSMPS